MKRICVYAGSAMGAHPEYEQGAALLGRELAAQGYELVYGGSQWGLMGQVADGVMEAGGKAIGVMPRGLFKGEAAHTGLTEFHEVADMHERKKMMADLSDAYIALPGGLGTLEELFEMACWAQIGIHHKPIGVLNLRGFYDPLVAMLQHTVQEGFMKSTNLELIVVESDPARLLERLATYTPVKQIPKWE